MTISRRTLGFVLLDVGACLLIGLAVHLTAGARTVQAAPKPAPEAPVAAPEAPTSIAQDEAPNRREFTITARDYRYSPNRLEVTQDDLVKVTIRSEDVAYSLTIDAYKVSRRVPAGGSTTLEFRADRSGTFKFYSNLTSDARHNQMSGELVVRAR
jgi:heme/copper-type cytochrome/quinol oxidase subunit 2